MRADVNEHVQIAGLAAVSAGGAFAAQADSLSIRDAFGDFDLDSLAADHQIHGRTEDGVAKIDCQLSFEIGAALRPLLETAASAEEVGEDVGEPTPAARRAPAAARTRATTAELREIESAERVAAALKRVGAALASEVERFLPQAVVLLALFFVGENGVGLGDLLELVLRVLVALVLVGMELLRQGAVGLLDLIRAGGLLHAEDVVVVLFGHLPTKRFST